ncbi:MAG: hypothetical protein A2Y82_01280 [Candidatus Buchananbacteria bacterium RBG_13_36_9]|uniref:Uncharacterized protein n=1 Tax=Candidatus Buchananbacteria bacterium RBG_13_36_9 TaxID=1797530 RepID=A0A1G1XPU0_9BACT|nr:MAG: hypothetical protein A2Y82_01280 [Candidatus Buchananbacteria bacterium RBG_13_36_9]
MKGSKICVVMVMVAMVIVACAKEEKPTAQPLNVVQPVSQVEPAKVEPVKKIDPCEPKYLKKETEIRELRLTEIKHPDKKVINVDIDDPDLGLSDDAYEASTDLTYNYSVFELHRNRLRTEKNFLEILEYFYQSGKDELEERNKKKDFVNLYVPELFRSLKSIPYQDKLYGQVITSPEKVAAQAVVLIKTMPQGKELALEWGAWFINRYKNWPWDAPIGILIKRTTVDVRGLHGHFCKTESVKEVLRNPHRPRRDAHGRFINEALGQCIPDNMTGLSDTDGYLCPVVDFADQKFEYEWSRMDKQVWRAGPKFYQNTVKIIRLVWKELGVEDPTISQ